MARRRQGRDSGRQGLAGGGSQVGPLVAGPTSSFPYKTLGAGGTAVYSGYIQNVEKSAELTGRKRWETFSNILVNTSIAAAGCRYFLNLLAKAQWTVEPVDGSSEAQRAADLVEAAIRDMSTPWYRVVRRAALYRFYGFGVQEWTLKRRADGSIGFLDIEPRPQMTIERWDVDPTGTLQGVVQRSPQTQAEIYLPRGKVLYLVDDALNDSPEGLGLVRHLVGPSRRLARYEQLEGFGFEMDLRGMPLARVPFTELQRLVDQGKITPAERDAIIQPLRDFMNSHVKNPELGVILDSLPYFATDEGTTPSAQKQWDLELMKADSGAHEPVAKAIERVNRELARILGVEQLLLGGDGKGSLALSKDKTQSFGLLVDGSLQEIGESAERDLVRPLMRYNGIDEKYAPRLKTEKIQHRDIEQVTQALTDMAQAGAPLAPNDPAVNEVRDLLGLSHVPEVDLDAAVLGDGEDDPLDPEAEEEEEEAETPEEEEETES